MITDAVQLEPYAKSALAHSFITYWSVKAEALKLGRIKSCRRSKNMDLAVISQDWKQVKGVLLKINASINKEHAANLRFIFENSEILRDKEKYTTIHAGKNEIKVFPSYDQEWYCTVIPMILNSNLIAAPAAKEFVFNSDYYRYPFIYKAANIQVGVGYKALRKEYGEALSFIERVENTFNLTRRIAQVIPNIKSNVMAINPGARIEFKGVSLNTTSAKDVLESAFVISNLDGEKEIICDGVVVKDSIVPVSRSRQEALNDYVQNVIVARRG